jgi:hypothetical protein
VHDTYCDEVESHVGPVCQKVHDLLVDFGVTPTPYNVSTVYIGPLFQWLSNGVGSLAWAGRSFRELSAVVSAWSLAHSICSLLKPVGDKEPSVTKSDLRFLHDPNFAWPMDTSVDKIHSLLKNIAKNFK